ncbi:10 kDa heat shock protein, mitochondrial-like [Mytilus edulis]|uniref:10 kDa heat shock protein, mitochondrial n=2 Tax=Mytilus TaxID=6548 RepID=A0A8B6GRZ3_MYTGA|nr:chaperonin GroES [Mytilus galloprovincialis]
MARAFKKFIPMFDRVLVERFAPELKTKSGLMIPEKAQGKIQHATVLAVGSGSKTNKGETLPMNVQVGDKVLLPEYGGTKIVLEDEDYFLFQEKDIIGKFES